MFAVVCIIYITIFLNSGSGGTEQKCDTHTVIS